MHQIRVIGPTILVQSEKKDETTQSGLIITGKDKDPVTCGTVLDIGQFKAGDDPHFTIGDKILYNKYAAVKIVVAGGEYWSVKIADVFAVVA